MSFHRSSIKKYMNTSSESIRTGVEQKMLYLPGPVYTLFYIMGAYLVLPIIEVPLLGLSISAPLFFLITLPCVFKPPRPWFRQYQWWIFLAVAIWLGIFLSTTLNGAFSYGVEVDRQTYTSLVQYLYWILVFVITAYVATQEFVLKKISTIFAWGILVLGVARLVEAVFFGKVGANSIPHLMTQNAYGFQFSTFTPFILIKIIQKGGQKKGFWLLALLIILGAAAINGSRGSWVAIAIGVAVSLLLLFFSKPRKFFGAFLMILLVVAMAFAAWQYLPGATSAVQSRLNTFQSLEEDKTYVIRQVLTQKGLTMFKESPIIGVGANRFTKTFVELKIPGLISYVPLSNLETRNSHNSYIQFLAEFGLIGSIPFGILLITLVLRGYKTTRMSIIRNDLIPLAIFSSFVQMSIHMWVMTALTGTITWFMYGLLTAVIMAKADKLNVGSKLAPTISN
jgi:oligosaccharide repeat unit polymerase